MLEENAYRTHQCDSTCLSLFELIELIKHLHNMITAGLYEIYALLITPSYCNQINIGIVIRF